MSLFGRLSGNQPPKLPAGAHCFVDGYGPLRDHYAVFYDMDDPKRVGPVFETVTGANMYRDWVNGDGPLNWQINGNDKAV